MINFQGFTFLSSRQASINEPYALFSEVIGNFLHLDSNQCEKRIRRWIEKKVSSEPIFLLVLDGINEHYNFQWWRELIEKLGASSWCGKVAVLITCRDIYWKRNFSPISNLETNTYKLPCYSEDELTEALKVNDIDRSQLSSKLFQSGLIYKPRYFDLVIQYQEKIDDIGNITVPRLIYEDWKNRYEKKRTTPITDDDFQQIIQDLAAKNNRKKTKET